MPLRIVKRGRVLYVRGTVRGQGIFETTGTADPKKAALYRAKREAELYEGAVLGARAVVSFQRAALAFLEHEPRSEATEFYIGRLVDHFGATPVAKIEQAEADAAVVAIVGAEAAPATKVRGVYTPLCTVLNFAAKRKWRDKPQFDKPRPPKGKTRWLTPAEALALTAAAAPHLKPLLLFVLCTGARLAEALDLRWGDVDLPAARVVFRDTKAGNDRIASLPAAALVMLANLPHRAGAVFRRDDGEEYIDRERKAGGQIKTAFHTAVRRAGIARCTPHDLRHTWATWFYGITKDLLLLKDEGGWATTRMCERYAHLMRSELVADISLVWGTTHPRIGALPGGNSEGQKKETA